MEVNYNLDGLSKANNDPLSNFFNAKNREVRKLAKKHDTMWISKTHEGKLYEIDCDTIKNKLNETNKTNQEKKLIIQTKTEKCCACEFNVIERKKTRTQLLIELHNEGRGSMMGVILR